MLFGSTAFLCILSSFSLDALLFSQNIFYSFNVSEPIPPEQQSTPLLLFVVLIQFSHLFESIFALLLPFLPEGLRNTKKIGKYRNAI